MRRILIALLALSVFGCSFTKVADPRHRSGAQGTPLEDDGGAGGGGGTPPAQIYFGTPTGSGNHVIPVFVTSGSDRRGWHVTAHFSSNIAFVSWTAGPLVQQNSPFPIATDVGGNTWMLDEAIASSTCVSGSGTWAYLTVSGSGTVTLTTSASGDPTPSPTLRDCNNGDLAVEYGSPSSVTL